MLALGSVIGIARASSNQTGPPAIGDTVEFYDGLCRRWRRARVLGAQARPDGSWQLEVEALDACDCSYCTHPE